MGEGLNQMYREVYSSSSSSRAEDEDELGESSSLSGASDDESESSHKNIHNKSSSASSQASLHELSSLVSQLPIKKGLSNFYQGKSQSFSSFSDVATAGDLAKKDAASKRTMKPSRSYGGGLDDGEAHQKPNSSGSGPKFSSRGGAKKGGPARASCASSIARTTSGSSYFASGKPPAIPMNKKM